eukprot:3145790-Prymnesium_polylepis.1
MLRRRHLARIVCDSAGKRSARVDGRARQRALWASAPPAAAVWGDPRAGRGSSGAQARKQWRCAGSQATHACAARASAGDPGRCSAAGAAHGALSSRRSCRSLRSSVRSSSSSRCRS